MLFRSLSSGDQTVSGTISGGVYTFTGLKYNLYDLDAEIDQSRYHDMVYVVVVDDPKHNASVPVGTMGLTVKGENEMLTTGPVSPNLYYDAEGKVSLTLPDGSTANISFPMHSFTEVEHDNKVYDHCDCGYEIYLHDAVHPSSGPSILNIVIAVVVALVAGAAVFIGIMWYRGKQLS